MWQNLKDFELRQCVTQLLLIILPQYDIIIFIMSWLTFLYSWFVMFPSQKLKIVILKISASREPKIKSSRSTICKAPGQF